MHNFFYFIRTVKFFSLFLLTFVAVFSFISCSLKKQNQIAEAELSEKSPLIIGFSQIGSESAWRKQNTRSVLSAAEKNGIQVVFSDAQLKQSNQIRAIRSFILNQVDVIVFVPLVENGWEDVLGEAKEADIPVIVLDRKLKVRDDSLYAGYLGQEGYEEGVRAAKFLVEKFSDTEEKVNIIQLKGTENSSVTQERNKGFREVLKDYPKFEIIYEEYGDFLRSRGEEIIRQIIFYNGGLKIGNKKIDVIFSQNDAMTLGALDVLKKNEISAGHDVVIVTVDAEQKIIDELKNKNVNCVVECNPNSGEKLMELVQQVAEGKEIPKITYIEEKVFYEGADLNYIPPRGY